MPSSTGFLVRGAVGADDHDGFAAVLRGEDRRDRNLQRLLHRPAGDGDLDRRADFQRALFVVDLQPDFDRGAAGIERGADQRNLRVHRIRDAGNQEGRLIADLHLLRELCAM